MTALYKTTGPLGEPIHGGSGAWTLPSDGQPGAWREETGPLEKCRRGLHLTDDPARWWDPGCRVWVAEAEGAIGSVEDDADRKVVCRRARLMREVTDPAELATLRIYVAGTHNARGETTAVASGSATVTAYDSATVEAYGSATVTAYGSATVTAYGSATVVSWWGRPGVRIEQRAVWIERGDESGPPVVHVVEVQP